MRGRKLSFSIRLSEAERGELEHWLRSTTMPSGLVDRGRAILLLSEAAPLKDVMVLCDLTPKIVRKWARRFVVERLAGLQDRPRSGRKPIFSP